MASKNDEVTGYCCCAIIVIALVVTAVSAVISFVKEHAGLLVGIGCLVLFVVAVAMAITRNAREQRVRAGASGAAEARPSGSSRTAPSPPSLSDSSNLRGAALHEREKFVSHGADQVRRAVEPEPRPATTENRPGALHDAHAPRPNGGAATSAPVAEPSSPAPAPARVVLDGPNGTESGLGSPTVEEGSSGESQERALVKVELWSREDLRWLIEKSLRRDGWAILRSGSDSARGGIDIIAGRGASKIAIQCYVPERREPLDESGLRSLLTAPFGLHGIGEVVVVSEVDVAMEVREAAVSSTLRVHIVDAPALEAWRLWESRLEPNRGLIAVSG